MGQPAVQIDAQNVLARGIRNNFVDTYDNAWKDVKAMLSPVMELDVPSDAESETYAYDESAPHPAYWQRGKEIPRAAFGAKKFSVANRDWGIAIDWHENDERYDQTKHLTVKAKKAGRNFARLPWRCFWQIVNGTTDGKLLPSIPNAPDGAALLSATDGAGANRFGVSGGNIVTGTGTTPAQIQADFYSALERILSFQDLEGEELWSDEMLKEGVTIFHGVAASDFFAAAFAQRLNVQVVQNAAASENVGGATRSNLILDNGWKVTLIATQKITDNDWYLAADGVDVKPFFQQVSAPLRDNMEDMLNSDNSRRTKNRSIQWDMSFGIGLNLPYGFVKVNN